MISVLSCSATVQKLKRIRSITNQLGFIYSTAGYSMLPFPGEKVYNSSKTALTYLTEGLRHELFYDGSKIKVTVSIKNTCG